MIEILTICTAITVYIFGIYIGIHLWKVAFGKTDSQTPTLQSQLDRLKQKVEVLDNELERLRRKIRGGGNPF